MSKDKDKEMSIEEWKEIVGKIQAMGYGVVLDEDDPLENEEEEDNESNDK